MKCLTILSVVLVAVFIWVSACSESRGSKDLQTLIEQDGVEAAIQKLRDLGADAADEYDLLPTTLYDLGRNYYAEGESDVALALAKYGVELFPESIQAHRAAAQACRLLGHRAEAREHVANAFALDTLDLNTLVQMKRIMFVPVDFAPPESLVTDEFRLRPIQPEDAELDYQAIMSSVDHLKGVLGRKTWPSEDMTLEENRESLVGHQREHETREAFCYTVMNLDESECLGCVYLYPSRWDDHKVEAVMWVSKSAFDNGLDPLLISTVEQWLADAWPFERIVYPGREVTWDQFFSRLEEQDKNRHW